MEQEKWAYFAVSADVSCIRHLRREAASILRTAEKRNWISWAEEEYKMKAGYRYLSFLFLSAALTAPVAIRTSAAQDDHRDEKRQTRVYDRSHKDYHNWDDNEDRNYRAYLGEQHQDYRGYSKMNRGEQNKYWNWRHSHPDSH
jgi:hypothetical protein